MKTVTLFFSLLLAIPQAMAQITDQLQDAIGEVPVIDPSYGADRDRSEPPIINSPTAYVFAYYRLPYAIDLSIDEDGSYGTHLEKVEVDFSSVDLSSDDEIEILSDAVNKLQTMVDRFELAVFRAGYRTNFTTGSDLRDFQSQGNAIIAVRELYAAKELLLKLSNRYSYLSQQSVPDYLESEEEISTEDEEYSDDPEDEYAESSENRDNESAIADTVANSSDSEVQAPASDLQESGEHTSWLDWVKSHLGWIIAGLILLLSLLHELW